LFDVKVGCIFFDPVVNYSQVEGCKVRVNFEKKFLESNFPILVLVEEVIEASCYTLHVVVLFLAETINKIFDHDEILSRTQPLEVVPQIEDVLLCNRSPFLP
jgi:hypothetical protein